jgi:hypothetical protein
LKGGDYVKQKTIEKIILLFDNGEIVYSKLHRKLPTLSNDEILSLMGYLSENTCLFTLSRNVSAENIKRYGFKENDVFTLTEDGENIRYFADNRQIQQRCTYLSILLSAIAAVTGIATVVLSWLN